MTDTPTQSITKPTRMRITQLMGHRQPQSTPTFTGGHRFWCSSCGGFRTHKATLGKDRRLTLECGSCEKKSVMRHLGGVWMPEHLADTMQAYIPWRTEQIVIDYLSRRESPTPVEVQKGMTSRILPALEHLTHREVGTMLESDATDGIAAVGPPTRPGAMKRSSVEPEPAEPSAAPGKREKTQTSARTRAQVFGWAVSAPFLAMGVLYVLAWRGTYVWPIYYAVKPYWQTWMNDWWFQSLSVVVPAAVAIAYRLRFGSATEKEDIIDWEPEPSSQGGEERPARPGTKSRRGTSREFARPDWLNEG